MTCTSKAFCEKNPSLCCCIPARKQRTCEELGVCNQVKGCKGCEAQAAPLIYLQTGIEPGDALPATPRKPWPVSSIALALAAFLVLVMVAGMALGWLWGAYQDSITQTLATSQQAATAYAQAAVRALWRMANLLA